MGAFDLARAKPLLTPFVMLAVAACARPPAHPVQIGSWSYEVDAPVDGSRVVAVEATFENARTERLAIARDSAFFVRDMRLVTPSGTKPIPRRGTRWLEPACTSRCTVRYRIDLGELAAGCNDEVDCARRVGESTLSPALAWLVHPAPRFDVPVTVHVRVPKGGQFLSGMHPVDAGERTFAFRATDLDEGSFTAFGPIRRFRVDVPSGDPKTSSRIDVGIVGKSKYAMSDSMIQTWVEETAAIVTPLFGRFPVDRTTLFIVPAKGETEVVFGKVLSLAGASVVLLVGDQMPASARHDDWVFVHELFHLGFPTFRGEGRWLGEGLATYYEPILRARAGWTGESDVFRQFARNMPRGIPRTGSAAALTKRDDLDSIYWGGALFCFAADVRIREETHNQHSLDDVVRAALARGGDATKVWTVAEVVKLGDEVTGTHVLTEMYERHAARGELIDLDGLMASLGVERSERGVLDLDDGRPLAWVRQSLVVRTRGRRGQAFDASGSRP